MASVALKVAGHRAAAHVQQGKLTPGKEGLCCVPDFSERVVAEALGVGRA